MKEKSYAINVVTVAVIAIIGGVLGFSVGGIVGAGIGTLLGAAASTWIKI